VQAIQWACVKYANEFKPMTVAAATIVAPAEPSEATMPTRKKRKFGSPLGLMAMSDDAAGSII
jgi:hypothetical protein